MLLQVLLLFAVQPCLGAVPWKTIGCDGWTYDGASIDDLWENAKVLADRAKAGMARVPTSAGFPDVDERRAGANAEFMWGGSFRYGLGYSSAGQSALATAQGE